MYTDSTLTVKPYFQEDQGIEYVNTPLFTVAVSNYEFSQKWMLMAGAEVRAGIGGIGIDTGVVSMDSASAYLTGGVSGILGVEYLINNDRINLVLSNGYNKDIGARFDILSGKIGGGANSPRFNFAEGGVKAGAGFSSEMIIDDFENLNNPARDTYLISIAAYLLETSMNLRHQNSLVEKEIYNKIVQSANLIDNCNYGYNYNFQGNLNLGPTLKIPIGNIESKFNIACLDIVGEYSYKAKVIHSDSSFEEIHRALLKSDIKFPFENRVFQKDVSIISNRNNSGNINWFELSNTTSQENSKNFFQDRGITQNYRMIVPEQYINEFFGISELANSINNKKEGISYANLKNNEYIRNDIYKLNDKADYIKETTEYETISIPFSIGLSAGIKLGISFDLEGRSEVKHIEEVGKRTDDYIFSENQMYLPIAEYDNSDYLEENRRKLTDLFSSIGDLIFEKCKDLFEVVDGAIDETVEVVGDFAIWAKDGVIDAYNNCKINVTKLFEQIMPSRIFTLTDEGIENQAQTVGEVYVVNLMDKNDNSIDDFSDNQLELAIHYTEDDLLMANLVSSDKANMAIYRWDDSLQYYIKNESIVNTEEMMVTATIEKSGQYIIAVDKSNPNISLFKTNNSTAFPLISAEIMDGFSGIDRNKITLEIDDIIVVNSNNINEFFSAKSGNFLYQVIAPLSSGEHLLRITVTDNAANTSIAELLIDIDDEYPEISELIFEQINDGISISFEATDNKDIDYVNIDCSYINKENDRINLDVFNNSEDNSIFNALVPNDFLKHNLLLTIYISDVSGNILVENVMYECDNSNPSITQMSFGNNSKVYTEDVLEFTFNEEILLNDSDEILLVTNDVVVITEITIDNNILRITPLIDMQSGENYSIIINGDAITDIDGNKFSSFIDTFTVYKLMGDTNDNGFYDETDLQKVIDDYARTVNDNNYNPDIDINNDYIIDVLDITRILNGIR
jgi:hypothetical protein